MLVGGGWGDAIRKYLPRYDGPFLQSLRCGAMWNSRLEVDECWCVFFSDRG